MQALHSGSRFLSVDFSAGDMSKVASAFGIASWRVETPVELGRALDDAFAHDGPAFLDIVSAPLHLELPPVYSWLRDAGQDPLSDPDDRFHHVGARHAEQCDTPLLDGDVDVAVLLANWVCLDRPRGWWWARPSRDRKPSRGTGNAFVVLDLYRRTSGRPDAYIGCKGLILCPSAGRPPARCPPRRITGGRDLPAKYFPCRIASTPYSRGGARYSH